MCKGKPVTLVACQTGKGDNSFAQKLANELKAPVRGVTENVSAVTGEVLNGVNMLHLSHKILKFIFLKYFSNVL